MEEDRSYFLNHICKFSVTEKNVRYSGNWISGIIQHCLSLNVGKVAQNKI